MEQFFRYSRITGKRYNLFETVKIVNLLQSMSYISAGVLPVDISISKNTDGKPCFVFLFVKEETKEVYDKWCNHELECEVDDWLK